MFVLPDGQTRRSAPTDARKQAIMEKPSSTLQTQTVKTPTVKRRPARFYRALRRSPVAWVVFGLGTLLIVRYIVQSTGLATLSSFPFAYAFVPSPNVDDRPPGAEVNCVVLHATVEPTTEGTVKIFLDPARKVSAHFVVGKDGRVVQMVPVEKRAWHAGVSEWDKAPHVNDYSVGIEIVNLNDGRDPYPDAQLQAVAGIIRLLRSRYPIPDSRIVSHADIALPTGRKSDPKGLDFDLIRTMATDSILRR